MFGSTQSYPASTRERTTDVCDARTMTAPANTYTVRSVDRAIDILTALADSPDGLTVTQIASQAGGSKSAVFSTVQTLVSRGLILSTGAGLDRRYQLGLELVRLGDIALQRFSFGAVAKPTLERLTLETGLTSRAATWGEDCAVVVARVDGRSGVKFDLQMGQRELLHSSGVGKAMLSTLDDERAQAILGPAPWARRTASTIRDAQRLLPDLNRVRERGFAVDDEEDAEGIICIGAPVLNGQGSCLGAISVTRIKAGMTREGVSDLGSVVRQHAQALTAQLRGDS